MRSLWQTASNIRRPSGTIQSIRNYILFFKNCYKFFSNSKIWTCRIPRLSVAKINFFDFNEIFFPKMMKLQNLKFFNFKNSYSLWLLKKIELYRKACWRVVVPESTLWTSESEGQEKEWFDSRIQNINFFNWLKFSYSFGQWSPFDRLIASHPHHYVAIKWTKMCYSEKVIGQCEIHSEFYCNS